MCVHSDAKTPLLFLSGRRAFEWSLFPLQLFAPPHPSTAGLDLFVQEIWRRSDLEASYY